MKRNFAKIPVFELINELRIFILVVLISDVKFNDCEPNCCAKKDNNGKGQI